MEARAGKRMELNVSGRDWHRASVFGMEESGANEIIKRKQI